MESWQHPTPCTRLPVDELRSVWNQPYQHQSAGWSQIFPPFSHRSAMNYGLLRRGKSMEKFSGLLEEPARSRNTIQRLFSAVSLSSTITFFFHKWCLSPIEAIRDLSHLPMRALLCDAKPIRKTLPPGSICLWYLRDFLHPQFKRCSIALPGVAAVPVFNLVDVSRPMID